MPVRDGGAWLRDAVESVRSQTLTDWELVLVDDHSRDGAPAGLAPDPRITVVPNRGRGLVEALNTGLGVCRAPFVARLDADDRMHPDRLWLQLAAMQQQPALSVVASRVRAFRDDGPVPDGMRRYLAWQNRLTGHEALRNAVFVDAPMAHPSVMMRREALQALGAYRDSMWAEDVDLWMRARAAGWRFRKLPLTLTDWRDHTARLTRTDPRCAPDRYIAARAHYLANSVLQGRQVALCGGGKHAIRLCRALRAEGVVVSHFYDIAAHRVGGTRQGCPVLPLSALSELETGIFVLGCVARPRARNELATALRRAGLIEGEQFLMAA